MFSVADFWFSVFWKRKFFLYVYITIWIQFPEGESFWAIFFPSENVPFHFSWGTDFLCVFFYFGKHLVVFMRVRVSECILFLICTFLRVRVSECFMFYFENSSFGFSWVWEFLSVSLFYLNISLFWWWELHQILQLYWNSYIFFSSSQLSSFLRRRILDLSANRNFTAMSAEFEAEAEAMAKAEQRAAEVYFLD